jgi:hypothetical protein
MQVKCFHKHQLHISSSMFAYVLSSGECAVRPSPKGNQDEKSFTRLVENQVLMMSLQFAGDDLVFRRTRISRLSA